MYRIAAATLALLALPVAHAAENPFPKVGFAETAKPFCLARTYDAAHLKAHPKQKVSAIALAYEPTELIVDSDGRNRFGYILSATLTGLRPVIANSGTCHAGKAADELICELEGDGGVVTLTKQADGKVLLSNADYFTLINDEAAMAGKGEEYVHIESKDDQAAFLLETSKGGLCDTSLGGG
ncbi:hypothetical protein sos41_09580 [Alphaproteobacteria bacterium SO-S41]|nr:hypothetical protein sos41_09580 [Alphaproteobacteria bacterium SO-S41]